MTNNPDSPTRTTQLTTPTHHLTTTSAPSPADRTFEMRFTSTPRGVRLARRLAAVRLDAWGIPYGSEPHDEIDLIVTELCANAVRHGHVPGRDFHLRLHAPADGRAVRVEVTDSRAERLPRLPPAPADPDPARPEESGRGLLLVSHLAARWDWHPCPDGRGKTVWAQYDLPGSLVPCPPGAAPASTGA
ncbi:ATP-binding protein [Streptomyces sparsogenes]|uniref:ATP-binding protein n=1 Tax=Streptomyces sparsogenes TaxID=67365 RepID=UPI0034020890